MRAINGSYFDPQLCMDGHFIITGNTNDVFYNPQLLRTDIKYELYRYLRHTQGFDAVVFLDRVSGEYVRLLAGQCILSQRRPRIIALSIYHFFCRNRVYFSILHIHRPHKL